MTETTKDNLCGNAARGLDLRDVGGAWLVCALVASIALAVSGDLHAPPASLPFETALVQAAPGNGEMLFTARNDTKTLFPATAALAIAGVVTVEAPDTFTCSGVRYATRDGGVELDRTAPVTIHWTQQIGGSQ